MDNRNKMQSYHGVHPCFIPPKRDPPSIRRLSDLAETVIESRVYSIDAPWADGPARPLRCWRRQLRATGNNKSVVAHRSLLGTTRRRSDSLVSDGATFDMRVWRMVGAGFVF